MQTNLQIVELALFNGYRCLSRKGETGSQWIFQPDSQPVKYDRYWQLENVVGEFEPAELNRASAAKRGLDWMFASTPFPNYLLDLNLLHATAMRLKAQSRYQYALYLSWLDKLTGDHKDDHHLEDAPAAIRAEALLRTLGKWTNE